MTMPHRGLINMNPSGGNFTNGIQHNLIESFSSSFFGKKLEIKTVCFENPELNSNNLITIRVEKQWFS